MKLETTRLAVLCAAGLIGTAADADAARKNSSPYTGSITAGFSQFDYADKLDAPLTFDIAAVNVTAGWDSAYLAIDVTRDSSAADISQSADTGSAGRDDQQITLGYRLSKRLWVYAADNDNETTMNYRSRLTDTTRSESYREEGLVYGFTYNIPLKRNGIIRFDVTHADLDTINQFGNTPDASPLDTVEFNELDGRRNGTTEGYGYGITWLMPLSETLYYQAQYRIEDYRQRVDVSDLTGAGREVDNTTDLSRRRLTMGFKFLF